LAALFGGEQWSDEMLDSLGVQSLTTCGVAVDGHSICINFNDAHGQPASLILPTDCAHQPIMTLPQLVSKALKAESSDDSLRAVFPLGSWQLERAVRDDAYILALRTTDGFDVSFSMSAHDLANMASCFETLDPPAGHRPAVLCS
jgi:hypothetical protein